MFFNKFIFSVLIIIAGTTVPSFAVLKVVTVTETLADIVRNVGGKKVFSESLINNCRDMHHIVVRPSMVVKVKDADMFVRIGMGADMWVNGILEVARNNKLFSNQPGYVDASLGVLKLDVPEGQVHAGMGDIHAFGNPHYWLDPVNVGIVARAIADALIAIDPENTEYYETNFAQYINRLEKRLVVWKEKMAPLSGKKILTYHTNWRYFQNRFNLNVVSTLEPKPGIPPTARHLNYLKKAIKENDVTGIFMAPYYNQKVAESLSEEMGIPVYILPDNIDSKYGLTSYVDLMDFIVDKISL